MARNYLINVRSDDDDDGDNDDDTYVIFETELPVKLNDQQYITEQLRHDLKHRSMSFGTCFNEMGNMALGS